MQMCVMVMSQSHRIEGRATDEAFEEQSLLWERGALFFYVQTNKFKTMREEKGKIIPIGLL